MKIDVKKIVLVTLLALMSVVARAQTPAYFQAVTNLNPVAYWPMHEIEASAQGDIETNYGTLGLLGTGYYSDWEGGSANSRIHRGFPGALSGDSDTAVYFGPFKPNQMTTTNGLYVPHTSPLATLVPPFSVECWYYQTNSVLGTNGQGDILGQNAFTGLNAGNNDSGNGNVCGFRLYWNVTHIFVFGYANSSVNNQVATTTGTVTTNQWYHIVVTCDANTNFSLWVDGASQGTSSGVGQYIPDYWAPFEVGNSRGDSRPASGIIDEVAVYTNVITDINTHYNDGIGGGAGAYFHDVTNDNPDIYLRMDGAAYTPPALATWPILTNYGSVAANGVYNPGTMPGIVPGPQTPGGVALTGLSGAKVPQLSGISSFADAGFASAYNPVGATAFSVAAMFRGNPCDGRVQTIVGHSDNSWRVLMNTNGTLQSQLGTNTSSQVNSVGVYNDGYWHQVVDVYTPNSTPTLAGTNALYVDGVLDSMTNGVATGGILPGTNLDVSIGAALDYTNNPLGVGRQFAGQVCEVALFTNALTVAQIQTLYDTSEQVPPSIIAQPQSANVNGGAGSHVNFSVTTRGLSPVYQWYFNSSSSYSGATKLVDNLTNITNSATTQLTVTNLTGANGGYYFVIVTNNYGSVTSILASLTVNTAPVIGNQLPVPYTNPFTLFSGVSPAFSVLATGAQPLAYYWFTNSVLTSAATNSSFTWSNVQIGSISAYCIVSNSLGKATGAVWTASVITDPTAPYPVSVLATNPFGYWRLSDTNLDGPDNGQGDDGYICHDFIGGNDGIYTNVILGQTGYNTNTDPSVNSAEFGEFGSFIPIVNNYVGQIQGVDFGTTNGGNGEFTVEAWVNGFSGGQIFGAPIATKGLYGVSDEFNLGVDSTKVHYRFYVRDASGTQHVVGSGSSPALDNNWHHVVGVCDEANGQALLYFDGKLASTVAITAGSGVYETSVPMSIGAGTTDGVNYTNQFYGYINDVAVYKYAMSASQVLAQYLTADVAPSFSQPPSTNVTLFNGATLTLPSAAIGTGPLSYQWYDVNGGTNVAMGSINGNILNTSLTVSNVPAAWNGDTLQLTVTNLYGSASISVVLTVVTPNPPQIAVNLPSPVTVLSGQSYVYSVEPIGPPPFDYQWYHAGAPVAGQTSSTYTVTAGSPGSTTYSVVITNIYGAVTSTVSTFTSISAPSQPTNPYATNILRLNPVGYWPMHEAEAPAVGDEEFNYGSLGQLGSGYYSDWQSGTSSRILRGYTGALKNDSDTATYFAAASPNVAAGTATTNALYVPHTSPLATLVPPFSVECWFYQTNTALGTNGQGDILGQSAYNGLNNGDNGSGNGKVCGFRLYWDVTRIDVFGYANSTVNNTLGTLTGMTTNKWYHFIVTCDANTNFSLYVNGAQAGSTTAGVGLYVPDYWMPFEVGNSRGDTHPINGVIDEVAVYTNVITDISTHYNDGLSGQAGQYKSDVLADNPVIYFWMDSPTYSVPATNTWPVLFNYGSAGTNGLYSPGTVPGIVSGPATSLDVPFAGLPGTGVAQLNGVSAYADAGYASAYNPVGAVPFSVSAMFRGNPTDGRTQDIVGHTASSWRIYLNASGQLGCQLGTNSSSQLTSAGVYNDGNWHQVVEVYTPASNPALNGTNALYVDGVLDSMTNGVTPNGILPGTNADVLIGTDPQFINTPSGVGRQFAGQVCEVALFSNALTPGQVGALYVAAVGNVGPFFAPAPATNITAFAGSTLTIPAGADGTPTLGYTWYDVNSGTNVATGTSSSLPLNTSLTVNSVPASWNGDQLELTLTNAYGSTNIFVALTVSTVNPNPTNIVFSVTGNQLTLTWPMDHTGWTLQAQTNSLSVGLSNNWVNVAGSTGTNQVIMPLNPANGTVFYRLMFP